MVSRRRLCAGPLTIARPVAGKNNNVLADEPRITGADPSIAPGKRVVLAYPFAAPIAYTSSLRHQGA